MGWKDLRRILEITQQIASGRGGGEMYCCKYAMRVFHGLLPKKMTKCYASRIGLSREAFPPILNLQNWLTAHWPSFRFRSGKLLAAGLLLCGSSAAMAQATITVDAGNVVRDMPEGLMTVCAGTKFWDSTAIPFRADLMRAKVGVVRIAAYPMDNAVNNANPGTLEELDTKVAQIINAGATPLFIQCIETQSTIFKEALLDVNGNPYGPSSTVPVMTRVATNMEFLVNRYKAAPYNLAVQYWEVGNEPDLANVNYQVATPQEYVDFFQTIHARLVSTGVRQNVILCGPAVSWEYGFGGYRDQIMNAFLAACYNQVDIVTRHVYGLIYSWENIPNTAFNQLNSNTEMVHFDPAIPSSRGEGALLAKMASVGVPSSVKTGITEFNLFSDNVQEYNHTITQGLWFLIASHFTACNPRSVMTNGFCFDKVNDRLSYYKTGGVPSFAYWATYMHGELGGDKVLAQTSSDPKLLVTATKDASYVYVRVINRNTTAITSSVAISNAPAVTGSATLFQLTDTLTPDVGTATAHGLSFSYTFPAMSASIFRYARTDAPVPPTEPAAPTAVLLDTTFDTAPSGMLAYTNNPAAFTPVVTSGTLRLTRTTANLTTAVVFNGQPLLADKTKVQVRFGFKVAQNYAEGFVFGAYSANPGTQGNGGQALGYQGQNNRIWGVKVDNNPDQIAILGSQVSATADGWVTQPLTNYAGQDLYMVIDYDGTAGKVRARLYQGTDDTGVLKADITNKVGVPANLPYGAVFGFTGATGSFSQDTYIQDLKILTAAENVSFVTSQVLSTGTQNNYQGWLGFKFTVSGQPLTISEVGRWVLPGNTGSHQVKIVNASNGTDVPGATATINTVGAQSGTFAYVPLAQPVVLSANTAYYIVSREPYGTDYYYNYRNVLQHTSRATINSSAFGSGSGTWATYGSPGNSYVPVSFKYQP
jgi:hypothetical protein